MEEPRGRPERRCAAASSCAWALAFFVLALCLAPFVLVLVISFGEKIEGADWRWALSLSSYQRFFFGFEWPEAASFVYPVKLWYSLYYAVIASLIAVA